MERIGRGGLVAQKVAVRPVWAATTSQVPAAGRDEAPRVYAGADGGRTGTGDDADLQAAGFGAPEGRVGVEKTGH